MLKRNVIRNFCLLFVCVFILAGCGAESLYQELSERDANEILVVLFQSGIDADKIRVEKPQEVNYSIEVPKDKIHQARSLLVENNLPRKKELGFSGICKEKGLIPTPEEEKCRRLLALKGEIINSLERVPGVIDADVVLNIPEVNEFSTEEDAKKKPTASAVLRVRKALAGEEFSESRIQRFISNSVENLDPRDVSVILSYVVPPQKLIAEGPKAGGGKVAAPVGAKLATIAGLTLAKPSVKRFKIYAVVMLLVLLCVSGALIVNVIKMTKMRQELKVSRAQGGAAELTAPAPSPMLEEGSKADNPQLKSGEEQAAPGATSPPQA